MTKLRLAVCIADLISDAFRRNIRLDIENSASVLAMAHPEAHTTLAEIENILRESNEPERRIV